MSGYSTNGLAAAAVGAGFPFSGLETVAVDTNAANGVSPQSESVQLGQLVGLVAPTALTDAATIVTDASANHAFSVTLAGNRTLANPTNLQPGRSYRWIITQDATGTRTLAFGNLFTFSGSSTVSTVAGRVDMITGYYDGTKLRCTLATNFA